VLGTVNAGKNDFGAAIRDLQLFRERFPETVRKLIGPRISMTQFPTVDWRQTAGIKTVVEIQQTPGS
jgi:hypothetical protein